MENNDNKHKKHKIEHNEEILREIRNRIMIEIWSIIPTSLYSELLARVEISLQTFSNILPKMLIPSKLDHFPSIFILLVRML